jgi:hypothetical protein
LNNEFVVCSLGFGIWDLGFGVWDLGFGVFSSSIHLPTKITTFVQWLISRPKEGITRLQSKTN